MSNPKFRKFVVYAMIGAMVLSSVMMGLSMFF
ncbi:stressosome-associated protein Prli42 [Chungangia koreensis]|uniref:Stressosome-associated protein Prli42 n=1 Tax=Chungangia koreensis TaxID=752657 RepID=A0ABV8X707_9LACT